MRRWPADVTIGRVLYPPGSTYGPRVQSCYQIVILHSGSLELMINGVPHQFTRGTALLLCPGWHEFFRWSESENTWHSWIEYWGSPPDEVAERLQGLPIAIPLSERMDRIVQDALYWYVNRSSGSPELVWSIAYHAALLYVEEAAALSNQVARPHELVYLVYRYVHRRLHQDLSLVDLARSVSVTPGYLCRIFRQAGYPSPMEWLWSLRIRMGVSMLSSTPLGVEEIARQCGFKSPFHFSRRVKQLTGHSPTEHRQLAQDQW